MGASGTGKENGHIWDLSKLTGWQERGGGDQSHNATTAKTLFVMLWRRGRNLFGNDYPPTTDEKRDHKFLRQCAATHE